jgi:hypothetical protein
LIYTRQITISAGAVVEVFAALGISPGRYDVTVQVISGHSVYLVEDGTGANVGPQVNWSPTAGPPPLEPYRFYTNRDPVYIKNYDSSSSVVGVALTAVP